MPVFFINKLGNDWQIPHTFQCLATAFAHFAVSADCYLQPTEHKVSCSLQAVYYAFSVTKHHGVNHWPW